MQIDQVKVSGRFKAVFSTAEGVIFHSEEFDNLLTQTGKAFILDQSLGGVTYTAADYLGLISGASFTGVSGGDTQVSHAGWLEAGVANAPTFTGTRGTCAWSMATLAGSPTFTATKSTSTGLSFTFTGAGTVQGAFIVANTGAVNTVGDTNGTLFSAGAFATPQPVVATNVLTITYSSTIA